MASMLIWVRGGVTAIALLNLVALVSLVVAYGWHCGLKPKFARRRARERSFQRLLAQSTVGSEVLRPEPSNAGERWEW